MPTDDATLRMKNTESPLTLAGERILKDFVTLRCALGADDGVKEMTTLTRAFEVNLEDLPMQLPQATYDAELPGLRAKFLTGCVDIPLTQMV